MISRDTRSSAEFGRLEPGLHREVVAALERAKTVGREVYAFVSPVLLPGAEAIGFDANVIRAQLTSGLSACQTVAGVHCLDAASFHNRGDLYFNLTHFNQRGHQVLAEWLAETIPLPRP